MGTVTSYTKAKIDTLLSGVTGGGVTEEQLNAAVALRALLQETVNDHGATGSAYTLPDVTSATVHNVTLNAATVTFTMPPAGAGKSFVVNAKQDEIGGRLAIFTDVIWSDDTPPTLATSPGYVDELIFRCSDAAIGWRGSLGGGNFSS